MGYLVTLYVSFALAVSLAANGLGPLRLPGQHEAFWKALLDLLTVGPPALLVVLALRVARRGWVVGSVPRRVLTRTAALACAVVLISSFTSQVLNQLLD